MPAGYTHYVFGEQVLSQLDENIKKRIMPYIDLYHSCISNSCSEYSGDNSAKSNIYSLNLRKLLLLDH